MIRIAVTGPESSGKTTLSKELAEHFQVTWFPEYAREYLTNNGPDYSESDLLAIAVEQEELRSENKTRDNILIYDTENIVIKIWSEFKYHRVSPEIISMVNSQNFDHYFLCSPEEIEWEDDPLRENPFERAELFEIYKKVLAQKGYPYTVLKGSLNERLSLAISMTEEMILSKGGFCL